MTDSSSISLETRILNLPSRGLSRIGPQIARKLALGLAGVSTGRDISTVNVEDLLHYLPMRYEDRSSLARIRDLADDTEASLELFVKIAGAIKSAVNDRSAEASTFSRFPPRIENAAEE